MNIRYRERHGGVQARTYAGGKEFTAHGVTKEQAGERPTVGTESLSSDTWPTARSNAAMAASINPNAPFPNLETVVAQWPTPRANTLEGRGCARRKPGTGGKILNEEAENWRTPSAGDAEGGIMEIRPGCNGKYKLRGDAANWHTLRAMDGRPKGVAAGKMPSVGHQAQNWATPTSRDNKDCDMPNRHGTPSLAVAGPNWHHSPQAQLTMTPGQECLQSDPISPPPSQRKRRLNYRFVQWLMGFPEGWL